MPVSILNFQTSTILRNVVGPVQADDAAPKGYVDSAVANIPATTIGELTVSGNAVLEQGLSVTDSITAQDANIANGISTFYLTATQEITTWELNANIGAFTGNLSAPNVIADYGRITILDVTNNAHFGGALLVTGNLTGGNMSGTAVAANTMTVTGATTTNSVAAQTASVTGNLTVGNVAAGNITTSGGLRTSGTLQALGAVNLGPVANLTITGGQAGYQLTTDGTGNLSWVEGNGQPSGSNTQVQFNANGSFGGSANLTFDGSDLSVGGDVVAQGNVYAKSNVYAIGGLYATEVVVDGTVSGNVVDFATIGNPSQTNSIQFNNTGGYTATNSNFAHGTNPFTLEWYQFIPEVPQTQSSSISSFVLGNLSVTVNQNAYSGAKPVLTFQIPLQSGGHTGGDYTLNNAVPGTWAHFAFVRPVSTNNLSFFVNGQPLFQGVYNPTYMPSSGALQIASAGSPSWAGLIAGIRWTNSELYTGAFTPPTMPLAQLANTQLLMNVVDVNNPGVDDTGLSTMATVGIAPIGSNRGPGDNPGAISIQAPLVIDGDYTLTLPEAVPANDQVMVTDANGNMSWVTLTPGTNRQVLFNDNGSTAGTDKIIVGNSNVSFTTDVLVTGNMQVEGNLTFINSNVIVTDDLYIVLANSTSNAAQADGAGFVIGPNGANVSFLFDSTNDAMQLSSGLEVLGDSSLSGTLSTDNANIVGDLTTNANVTMVRANVTTTLGANVFTANSANITTLIAANPANLATANTQVATTAWTQSLIAQVVPEQLGNTPATAPAAIATAGTANTASRSDHVHPFTTAAQALSVSQLTATPNSSGYLTITTTDFLNSNGVVAVNDSNVTNNRFYLPTFASGFMSQFTDFQITISNFANSSRYPITLMQDPALLATTQPLLLTEVTIPNNTAATVYLQRATVSGTIYWNIVEVSMSDCVSKTNEWVGALMGAPASPLIMSGSATYDSTRKAVQLNNGSGTNGILYGYATASAYTIGINPTNVTFDFAAQGSGDGIVFNFGSSNGAVAWNTNIDTTIAGLDGIAVYLDVYNNRATLFYNGVSQQVQANLSEFINFNTPQPSRHTIKFCTFGNGYQWSGGTTPQGGLPGYLYVYLDGVIILAASLAAWVPTLTGNALGEWGVIGWSGASSGQYYVSSVTFDFTNDPSPVYGFSD